MRPEDVRQKTSTDCGPACLEIVCRIFGLGDVRMDLLKRLSQWSPEHGTSLNQLKRAAKQIGLKPKVRHCRAVSELQFPAIVALRRNPMSHFVVVARNNTAADSYTVFDPAKKAVSPRDYSAHELASEMEGAVMTLEARQEKPLDPQFLRHPGRLVLDMVFTTPCLTTCLFHAAELIVGGLMLLLFRFLIAQFNQENVFAFDVLAGLTVGAYLMRKILSARQAERLTSTKLRWKLRLQAAVEKLVGHQQNPMMVLRNRKTVYQLCERIMALAATLTEGVLVGGVLIVLASLSPVIAGVYLLTVATSWLMTALSISLARNGWLKTDRSAFTKRARMAVEASGLAGLLLCAHHLMGHLTPMKFVSIVFCGIFMLRPLQRVMSLLDVGYDILSATRQFNDENHHGKQTTDREIGDEPTDADAA